MDAAAPVGEGEGTTVRAGAVAAGQGHKRQGSTEGMNGNVFECYEEQSDRRQYAKTLEVLDRYVRKTLKYSEDLAPLFADTMAVPMVDMPDDLDDDAGLTMKMIFAEEVKA